DGALAACQLVHRPRADPVDAHDVGAEVGQDHPAERRGREPCHLDDADSLESAHATSSLTEASARTQAGAPHEQRSISEVFSGCGTVYRPRTDSTAGHRRKFFEIVLDGCQNGRLERETDMPVRTAATCLPQPTEEDCIVMKPSR